MHTITTKEELRNHIHRIHDFLRNNGIGIGMTALRIFNMFYALKLIDGKTDKIGLSNICSWKRIKKLKEDTFEPHFIGEKINGLWNDNVMTQLNDNKKTSKTIYYELPQPNADRKTINNYLELIKLVDQIPIDNKYDVDLAGKIYEYFIGYSDKSSMSDLGAFFTDRHITNFIMKEINPVLINNKVPTMIDMFGGSGGFTLTYTRHFKETYSELNWSKNINKIHHYDLSADVVKSASLEMFALTGEFPNYFSRSNSFTHSFKEKYHYIISNPPYGGDKIHSCMLDNIGKIISKLQKEHSEEKWAIAQLKELRQEKKRITEELNKYTVNIDTCEGHFRDYVSKFRIENKKLLLMPEIENKNTPVKDIANDKEACSLLLLMYLLADGGTAVGVLKEGIFFDNKYALIRRALIDNFNVEQIISVPADQFENTTTKTSIIIFHKKGVTEKITFSEVSVDKYNEDNFQLVDNKLKIVSHKDEIINVHKKIITVATYDDVVNMHKVKTGKEEKQYTYTFDAKQYLQKKQVVVCDDKYEMVKLNTVMKFMPKSKRNSSFANENGKYNFYTSSYVIKKCDIADYKEHTIIIGDGGDANIKIDNCFSCSSHNHLLQPIDNEYYILYIYSYIYSHMDTLRNGFSGSVIKNIQKHYLENLLIPIPKTPKLLQQWSTKLSNAYNLIQTNKKQDENIYEQLINELRMDINITYTQKLSDNIKLETITKDISEDTINSNEPQIKKKKEKNNYTTDTETKHIISDEPTIKKKTKKIVKEHNSNDAKDTNHTVSDEQRIKTKKIIKKEYDTNNQETKHIVSDEPRMKKKNQ